MEQIYKNNSQIIWSFLYDGHKYLVGQKTNEANDENNLELKLLSQYLHEYGFPSAWIISW